MESRCIHPKSSHPALLPSILSKAKRNSKPKSVKSFDGSRRSELSPVLKVFPGETRVFRVLRMISVETTSSTRLPSNQKCSGGRERKSLPSPSDRHLRGAAPTYKQLHVSRGDCQFREISFRNSNSTKSTQAHENLCGPNH